MCSLGNHPTLKPHEHGISASRFAVRSAPKSETRISKIRNIQIQRKKRHKLFRIFCFGYCFEFGYSEFRILASDAPDALMETNCACEIAAEFGRRFSLQRFAPAGIRGLLAIRRAHPARRCAAGSAADSCGADRNFQRRRHAPPSQAEQVESPLPGALAPNAPCRIMPGTLQHVPLNVVDRSRAVVVGNSCPASIASI